MLFKTNYFWYFSQWPSIFLIMSFLFFILSSGTLLKLIMLLLITVNSVAYLMIYFSVWWGLMLFLTYISGLLILFSYFTVFSPKEKMNFQILMMLFLIFPLKFFLPSMSFFSFLYMNWVLNNMIWYMILGIILFLILLMSCMMCFKLKFPLRSFMEI